MIQPHERKEPIISAIELTNSGKILGNCSQILIYSFECLASTNQTLWELIASGVDPGTGVVAAQQTAGRGQWGHQWHSSVGGLYLSLFLTPHLPATQGLQLTLATAWGIAQTFRAAQIPIQIKWPNDLILNQRKLGGILTETKVQKKIITQAVVGVGINWTNGVPATGINLQSYLETTHPLNMLSLEEVLKLTLIGLVNGCTNLENQGFQGILPHYLELLTHQGAEVWVNNQRGRVIGVALDGRLRVQLFSRDNQETSEVLLEPGTISLGYQTEQFKLSENQEI